MQQLFKALVAWCFLLSLPVGAVDFTVNSTSTSGDFINGDGICEDFAGRCTLPAALDESNALPGQDTINLPAGVYAEGGFINDGLILVGAGTSNTIIDGTFLDFFTVNAEQPVSISGLTIRDVTGTGSYAVYVGENADVTLSDIQIHDIDGPAIITHSLGINQLTINNALLEANSGSGLSTRFGGAIYMQGSGNVVVNDTTISGNTADFGGAIYLKGTTLTLNRSTVSGNSSTAAINVNGGFGGGGIIVSGSGSLTAINSTFSGNQAISSGGGIVIDDGTVSLYSSTVTDNHADSDSDLAGNGGGIIATTGAYSTTNVLNLRNSIIAKNSAALNQAIDCSTTNMTVTSFGYNLLGAGSDTDCLITPAAGDQFGTVFSIDPLLGPLADNEGVTQTHLLTSGSPALDAGNPSGCEDASATVLEVDQRGLTRPLDGGIGLARCDIGSVEMDVSPVADAGSDLVVQFGDNVMLTGAGSSAFAGIASYSWSEAPTPSVTLNDVSTVNPSFIAPSTAGDIVFDLLITDNNANTDSDSMTVTVNAPPVADAGPDTTASLGQNLFLDAAASVDSDGTIDVYGWSQIGGTGVTLNNAGTSIADFTVDLPVGEVLIFELVVTDNTGVQDTDSIEITIIQNPAIDTLSSVLKSAKKLQKKSTIKEDSKSKKSMKKGVKHVSQARAFYTAGDIASGEEEVIKAIADFRKVKKLKSKVKKLIKKLQAIE